ncbi:MAG: hypothetical protein ABR505_00580 [Actinomycetota bacterium]
MDAQRGQAFLETLLLSLLLLVPLLWLLTVLAHVHRGALGATAAAREAGFEAAHSTDLAEAGRAVDNAVEEALFDHGLDPRRAKVRWTSTPELARGGIVEVEVSYAVPVFAAPFLGSVSGPSITLEARHRSRIDPYRSRSG